MVVYNLIFTSLQLFSLHIKGAVVHPLVGEEGLKEFCYSHSVVRQRWKAPLPLTSFARTAKHEEMLGKIVALVHGGK